MGLNHLKLGFLNMPHNYTTTDMSTLAIISLGFCTATVAFVGHTGFQVAMLQFEVEWHWKRSSSAALAALLQVCMGGFAPLVRREIRTRGADC